MILSRKSRTLVWVRANRITRAEKRREKNGTAALGVVLPSGLRCQHSLAGRLGDLAGHDGVDDGVVDVRQALN